MSWLRALLLLPAGARAAALATLLAACASLPPPAADGATWVAGRLELGGAGYAVDWWLPAGPALALVTVQHGFARDCAQLRQTSLQIARQGLVTLCVNAAMAGGNPALAEALAAELLSGLSTPDGRPLPQKVVVAGHSAGAAFAARVGHRLAAAAPERLAGALLFDPVAVAGFADDLAAVWDGGRRPVLAITAGASRCNANHNAYPALRRLRQEALASGLESFVGLQLTDGSTHVDAEGEDSDLLGTAACGSPQGANVQALRTLAAGWALDMASGRRASALHPGGDFAHQLVAQQRARAIE